MSRFVATVILLGAMGTCASGAAFDVPIDQSQSTLTFELCIAGSCDADSSAVTGAVTVDLDAIEMPTQVWLHDFDLQLVDDLHWNISWSFLGSFTADLTAAAMMYADPNTVLGPEPVTGGTFMFTNVPTDATGLLSYTATGLPCTALQQSGMPCTDTRDLADEGTQNADEFSGTVATMDRVVTLTSSIDVTVPLDPNNPSLGDLHVFGTVTGSVYVPVPVIPGDLNCDGAVDFGDINPFVLRLTDPAGYDALYPDCPDGNADISGDGIVDFNDINPFVQLLTA